MKDIQDDILQNLLHCMSNIVICRGCQKRRDGDQLYNMVGEMDWVTEFHRQAQEIRQ